MDYLGWELERQKAALTALLLGGGTAEEERAFRQRERGTLAEESEKAGSARRDGKGTSRDRAGGTGRELPGDRRVIQEASRDRWRETGTGKAPESAWEEILGVEPTPEVLERRSWGIGAQGPGETDTSGREASREPSGDGVVARERSGEPSIRPERRGMEEEAAAVRPLEPSSEFSPGRMILAEAAIEWPPPASDPGAGWTAGRYAAGRPERGLRPRRSGGDIAEVLGQDGLPVFYEAERTGGTGPWRGGPNIGETRAEDGARALSRVVQRDARRYDGGFTIY